MLYDHKPFLLVVSAPSGCGKTTLLNQLFRKVKGLVVSVSHTTRKPRNNETDAVDYHFVDSVEFSRMQNDGQFLESATVHGNSYGTSSFSLKNLMDNGRDVVLDIDVQGMKEVKSASQFDLVTIFILPPSMEELESRLRNRQTDADAVIKKRLLNAAVEISNACFYDYIILNENIDLACERLKAIVYAERSRSTRTNLMGVFPD
ncbi:MAG: guanylate kinase [Pseudomonadota bacterium]|nr:guanylate kinase [Pseudomonadota bacterium]